jgi:hypothetical protein
MNCIKVNFAAGGCSIDWNTSVSGARLLAQKAAIGIMTDEGSDKSIPSRGNRLRRQIIGIGAYDLQGVQHSLNFAAAKTGRDIKRLSDNTDPSEQLARISLKLTGLLNGVVSTNIAVTNVAGTTIGINLDV